MSRKKISFGFILGSIGLAVESLSGLAILPMLLHFLPKNVAGLWILFGSFQALFNLSQTGFSFVVIRMAAEVKNCQDQDKFSAFYHLITTSYKWVVSLIIMLTFLIYAAYIYWVLLPLDSVFEGTIVWLMLSAGFAIRFYAMKNLHIVNGFGELGRDKMLQIITTSLTLLFFYIVLHFGLGLYGLGAVALTFSMVYWLGSMVVIKRYVHPLSQCKRVTVSRGEKISFLKQASKMLVLSAAAYLTMYTDVVIVERLFGLGVLPQFSALVKIVSLVMAISLLLQQMTYPYIAINWSQRNYSACFELYKKGILYSVGIGFIMSILVFILAPFIVPLWLGKGTYLGPTVFGFQLLYGIIYIHHCAHASPVVATGANAFIIPAIINALIAIPSSILGGIWFGITGIIIGNLIAMAITSTYVVTWSIRFFSSKRYESS